MLEYQVRRVEPDDWHILRAVRLRSLADTPEAFGTTLAEDEARPDSEWQARAADNAVAQFLAVTADGSCLGIAVGAPYTGYTNAAGLFGMWVAPKARRRKVGHALVEAVVAWARHEEYGRIVLDVANANAAAIRLYQTCGFMPTGKTGTLPPPRQHVLEHERALSLE